MRIQIFKAIENFMELLNFEKMNKTRCIFRNIDLNLAAILLLNKRYIPESLI